MATGVMSVAGGGVTVAGGAVVIADTTRIVTAFAEPEVADSHMVAVAMPAAAILAAVVADVEPCITFIYHPGAIYRYEISKPIHPLNHSV